MCAAAHPLLRGGAVACKHLHLSRLHLDARVGSLQVRLKRAELILQLTLLHASLLLCLHHLLPDLALVRDRVAQLRRRLGPQRAQLILGAIHCSLARLLRAFQRRHARLLREQLLLVPSRITLHTPRSCALRCFAPHVCRAHCLRRPPGPLLPHTMSENGPLTDERSRD
jgi:hypothetical protein